ncbi:MAG TPA: TIGR01777 family oxidoreductase [Flavobacteriales bacterium]|nr:TIGR01777 family oxidoreductase [Flavobacteriales bacterium]
MAIILISGGSGLIGTALTSALLAHGHDVRHLSRARKVEGLARTFPWNMEVGEMDRTALEGVDHIVHLAGAAIAEKRWSKARVRELITSRTASAQLLLKTCKEVGVVPKSFVSAAGIGHYGAVTTDHLFVEGDPPGTDTIGWISAEWERAVDEWSSVCRTVKLRTPMVLARNAGALKTLGRIARLGIASPLGSGKQTMPWIHIDDLVQAYIAALLDERWTGAYNIVAAEQPSNAHFMRTLAATMKRPWIMPAVPSFVLRALLGDLSSVLLNGSRASGARAQELGFAPRFDRLDSALEDLYA